MAWSSGFVIASALLIHALAQPPIQTDQCFIPSGIATSSYSHYAHTEDPARCVADSGVTSFAGCLEWDRLITSCSSYAKASQASAYYNCYCHQDYLNALYDCNDEERRCFGATIIDNDFTNDYNCWHSVCDPIVNYEPTSPTWPSITAPYDVGFCTVAQEACSSMSNWRFSCYNKWHTGDPTTSVSNCLCSPPVLSQEFTCSFLANISCAQVPAHLDHMSGWTFCDNLQDVITVPPSLTGSLGDATTTRWTYYTPSTSSTTALRSMSYAQPSETTPADNSGSTASIDVAMMLMSAILATSLLLFMGAM